jgi:hypothetical protein
MRLDLQLERVQARLGQRRLEPRRRALAVAIFLVVLHRVVRRDDAAVHAQLQRQPRAPDRSEALDELARPHRIVGPHLDEQHRPPRRVEHREHERRPRVHRHRAKAQRDHRHPGREPADHRKQHEPAVPDQHLVREHAPQLMTVVDHADPDLQPAEEADRRPQGRRQKPQVVPTIAHGASVPHPPRAANPRRSQPCRGCSQPEVLTVSSQGSASARASSARGRGCRPSRARSAC